LSITGGAIGGDDTQPYVFNGTVSNLRLDVYDNSTDRGYDETITGVNIPLSSLLGNGVSGGHYFITTLSISDILSGNDRVQDLVTDSFQGNKLTVSLFGYDGNDTLVGGAAQDTYVGGSGSDTFMPGAHTGTNDTVLDFTPGVDRIDFTGVRMTLAGAFLNATQVGNDTVITLPAPGFNADGRITLLNVQRSDLHAGDFTGFINKVGFEAPAHWSFAEPSSSQGFYVGDFNGDHHDDILNYAPGSSGAQVSLTVEGDSFGNASSWTGAGNDAQGWYVGDFNGDGRDDIFRYHDGVSGAEVLLSTGSNFANPVNWTGAGNDGHWYVGDFNGDSRSDIFRYQAGVGVQTLLSNGSGFGNPVTWTGASTGSDGRWYVGDFNGDGRDDIFRYVEGQSGADMFLSNGSGFVRDHSWTGAGQGTDATWYVADLNGDTRDDIFRYVDGQSGADVFLSDGTNFVHDGSWTGASKGSDGRWYIGDFDADGTADLMRTVTGHGAEVLI
jgi:hypothetical protein